MRHIVLALFALCLSACATFGREPVADLTPVFGNESAYDGRVFVGDVYVVSAHGRNYPGVALTLDADTYISLDNWSARRLHNYYGYRHGHRIRIRAIIREERIIVTQSATAACQSYFASFYLTGVRVLRGPEQLQPAP